MPEAIYKFGLFNSLTAFLSKAFFYSQYQQSKLVSNNDCLVPLSKLIFILKKIKKHYYIEKRQIYFFEYLIALVLIAHLQEKTKQTKTKH